MALTLVLGLGACGLVSGLDDFEIVNPSGTGGASSSGSEGSGGGTTGSTVGGNITGLVGSIVLQENGGNDLTLTKDGSFTFPKTLAPGTQYVITVLSQPSFPPRNQKCTITNGSGTMGAAGVTNVSIACVTETYSIRGNAIGLAGSLVLENNGTDNLIVPQSGAFSFMKPVASGDVYAVTVVTPPAGQTCAVTNGSGTVANGEVNDIEVVCSPPGANQGILCGAAYCDPSAMLCCLSGNVYACVTKCNGAGKAPIACDSAADCNGGLVCCGSLSGNTIQSIACTDASSCVAPKAFFCNPSDPNPCPNGGTCTSTDAPTGYYRCF